MATTRIEWATHVWNPTTGCDRISAGCDNCYALTMARRLKAMGSAKYQNDGDPRTSGPGFGITIHPDTLTEPFTWAKPRKVFVNSMSDLFHARVPLNFVRRVFEVIEATPQHTYQVLTKRAARLPKVADQLPWPRNLWLGVSVENQEQADARIPALLETPAAVRWISAEPLLGPIDLAQWLGPHCRASRAQADRPFLDWVVAGGESGPGARPAHPGWFRTLRDQCQAAGVAFHFKQWGAWQPEPIYDTASGRFHVVMPDGRDRGVPWSGWKLDQPDAVVMERVGKGRAGRELDGRTWDQFPEAVPA